MYLEVGTRVHTSPRQKAQITPPLSMMWWGCECFKRASGPLADRIPHALHRSSACCQRSSVHSSHCPRCEVQGRVHRYAPQPAESSAVNGEEQVNVAPMLAWVRKRAQHAPQHCAASKSPSLSALHGSAPI
jgi:hypothetical protein